jgi:hypothetical protein
MPPALPPPPVEPPVPSPTALPPAPPGSVVSPVIGELWHAPPRSVANTESPAAATNPARDS